jgi:hypothetical protein
MKYADEMGSGAMIYVPSFIEISSSIQKLMGGRGISRYIDIMVIAYAYFLFLQNKESRFKKVVLRITVLRRQVPNRAQAQISGSLFKTGMKTFVFRFEMYGTHFVTQLSETERRLYIAHAFRDFTSSPM